MVNSGGFTTDGQAKRHLWYRLTEPTHEVARVGALRKALAAKVGGDQSFGRITQVIRIPGSVHGKNGQKRPVEIVNRSKRDFDLEDLADAIEAMEPMPGIEPAPSAMPLLRLVNGVMDFSAGAGLSSGSDVREVLHRDVHEGGADLTRFSEASNRSVAQSKLGTQWGLPSYFF